MSNEASISESTCLSLNTMSELVGGQLTGSAAAHAKAHIASCPLCADIMQDVTAEDLTVAEKVATKTSKKIAEIAGTTPSFTLVEKLRMPIAAGLSGLVLVSALYLLLPINSSQIAEIPISRIEISEQKLAELNKNESTPTATEIVTIETEEPVQEISPEIVKEESDIQEEAGNAAMEKAEKKLEKEEAKVEKISAKEVAKEIKKEEKVQQKAAKSGKRVLKVRSVQILNKMFAGGKTNKKISPNDMPEFYGGQRALENYIKKEMKAMVAENEQLRHTSVVLSFVVNQKGKVSDVEAMSGISREIDSEAVKIVKNMPDWSSGKKGKIQYMMSITFE